jgi:hypothetical protein
MGRPIHAHIIYLYNLPNYPSWVLEHKKGDDRYLAVVTHMRSRVGGIISAIRGKNSMEAYSSRIQVLFASRTDHDSPAYFRIMQGATNSVASLVTSMKESGVKRVVLVANTGFNSSSNLRDLNSI